jgi:lycopene cyclase domain-containing protein
MATYLILNIVFTIVILLALGVRRITPSRAWMTTVIIIVILTAIFDSMIVGLSIVSYNHDKIMGIFVGLAPIEDFFYALFACIIVPFLWNGFSIKKDKK